MFEKVRKQAEVSACVSQSQWPGTHYHSPYRAYFRVLQHTTACVWMVL